MARTLLLRPLALFNRTRKQNRLIASLGYDDVWPSSSDLIVKRFSGIAPDLSKTMRHPPKLLVVIDTDMPRIHENLSVLAGIPKAIDTPGQNEDGFTIYTAPQSIIVLKDSVWDGFLDGQAFANGTVAHELGHVEEQLRFGPYPTEKEFPSCSTAYCNYWTIWSEFFAEMLAAPYYDNNRFQLQQNGLANLIAQSNESGLANHIGRMLGFAFRMNMDLQSLWKVLASYGPIYEQQGRLLWPIFTTAAQNGEIPRPS